jgi:ATP-dependent DNA helicase RecG
MASVLDTPIEYLKGVGPQRGTLLRTEIGIYTFRDLLFYFPFRYIDRSVFQTIANVSSVEGFVQLTGKIVGISDVGKGRNKRLLALFEDETGVIELNWFRGGDYLKNSLKLNQTYIVFGKPRQFGHKWSIAHPELSLPDNAFLQHQLHPVYSSTEKMSMRGLHSKGIEKLMQLLFEQLNLVFPDFFSSSFLQDLRLLHRNDALRNIHFPSSIEMAEKARFRLKFEELFFLQLELAQRKELGKQKHKSVKFNALGQVFLDFYNQYLPFSLTNAQKRVVKEIRSDFQTGVQMNRLLQGDVGSGKTMVALLSMLIVVGNDCQACLLAPTEILAQQHFETIKNALKDLNIRTELLTGSTKQKERKVIFEALETGKIHLLIGTHAILETKVKFHNLAFAVIDEQHRFGVAQRAKLWKKNALSPHILVMTATPIPRTLAMSFYGDLDVSVIDELPPGRKPITTVHYKESARLKLFGFIENEIAKGRQIYIVYPLISESENMDYQNLEEGFVSISKRFPLPQYKVSIVHGKMKPADKDFEMERFVKGDTHIMVATTVIEVGVNVPNASVMVVESAERFGLSQLHQLRGRVGRGAEQSYCILMTGNKLSKEANVRLETMCNTTDGFEIAEVDLKLRGPGDIMGTQQSGALHLKIADLAKDGQLLGLARQKAIEVFSEDPDLCKEENRAIGHYLKNKLLEKPNWSVIS